MKNKFIFFALWCICASCLFGINSSAQCIISPSTSTLCSYGTVTLTITTTPGSTENWTSDNTAIATVSSAGIGLATVSVSAGAINGIATISYDTGTGVICTASVLFGPFAGVVSGPGHVCAGSTINMTDNGEPGGTWSSGNTAIATVNSSTGVVTGVAQGGPVTIVYTVPSCGPATAFAGVIVDGPVTPHIATPGGTSLCTGGAHITLSGTPSLGMWNSSNPSVATVSGGTVTSGMMGGTTTISYTITNTCNVYRTTTVVSVNPYPGVITGPGTNAVCVGLTLALSTTGATGGGWTSSNSGIADVDISTGVVTGMGAGTATISYAVVTSCGTGYAFFPVEVDDRRSFIYGPSAVCSLSVVTLTGFSPGGTWSSSNTSIADVDASGNVTGMGAGTATISYAASNSCSGGPFIASVPMEVDISPNAGSVTYTNSVVCQGANIVYSSTGDPGTWSSSDGAVASINASTGVITGVGGGTATITYTVTNACTPPAYAYQSVSVTALPVPGTITGTSTICYTSATTLTDPTGDPGGTWSSPDATVTVGSTPPSLVAGVSAGTATISYTVSNSCATYSATFVMTLDPNPSAGTISGPIEICAGSGTPITLSDPSTGGIWTSDNTSIATAGISNGIITGVSAGTTTITYTVTNTCGSPYVTYSVTVRPFPVAGTITGATTDVCLGSTINLTDATGDPGGVWSSSNTTVATVGTSGIVTGIVVGTATISYTVTNLCFPISATYSITVNPLPNAGAITGPTSVCVGDYILLSDSGDPGGAWTMSNPSVGTIDPASGVVTGISAGTALITYTVTSPYGCGTPSVTYTTTVNPLPVPGSIYGAVTVCEGATITLTDGGASGTGVWSSYSTAIATVGSSSGIVTGVYALFTTISYSVTSPYGCGTLSATHSITVNPLADPGTITGAGSVCLGSNITLTDATGGGIWSSSNASIASVSSSIVSGVTTGTATISYTVTNGCGSISALHPVTVNPLPNAGTITGATYVCESSNITLSDGITGGTWSSSQSSIASINTSTGVITGTSGGTVTITYTVTSPYGCGSDYVTHAVTVNPLADPGTITGDAVICPGTATTLSDASGGGTWASSNTYVATISTGVVTGVSAGTVWITYTVSNSCGPETATYSMTVAPSASMAAPAGYFSVCPQDDLGGPFYTWLTGSPGGGTWSSSNATYAPVVRLYPDSAWVTGLVPNTTVTITYTTAAGCIATRTFTVYPIPIAGTISGLNSIQVSNSTTYSITGEDVAHDIYQWYTPYPGLGIIGTSTSTSVLMGAYYAVGTWVGFYITDTNTGCMNLATYSVTVTP